MIQTLTMPSGLRVIWQNMPQASSVAMCIFVRAGAVDERPHQLGLSHFIEHMLFKGTTKRTAQQLSLLVDNLGGQINAYTAKENTCFHLRLLPEDLPVAFDILCDMLRDPTLAPQDIAREQGVVVEEIAMVEDTPEDLLHETLNDAYFAGHPLAQPILGLRQTVNSFAPQDIRDYMATAYTAQNIVVSFAGRIDEDQLQALCDQYLADWPAGAALPAPPQQAYQPPKQPCVVPKPVEQVHFGLAYPGLAMGDAQTYTLMAINNLLGGGMSSRLFQTIREERGLAYSVYTYPSFYTAGGMVTLYAGTSAEQVQQVAQIMLQQTAQLADGQITQQEFDCALRQMRGNYLLGQDSVAGRAQTLGRSLLLLGRAYSQQQVLDLMQQVTLEDARQLAARLFSAKPYAAAVGQVAPTDPWAALFA